MRICLIISIATLVFIGGCSRRRSHIPSDPAPQLGDIESENNMPSFAHTGPAGTAQQVEPTPPVAQAKKKRFRLPWARESKLEDPGMEMPSPDLLSLVANENNSFSVDEQIHRANAQKRTQRNPRKTATTPRGKTPHELAEILRGTDMQARWDAESKLIAHGLKSVDVCLSLLGSYSPATRSAACRILMSINAPYTVYPALLNCIKTDSDVQVRSDANTALRVLTNEDARYRADAPLAVRENAVRTWEQILNIQ